MTFMLPGDIDHLLSSFTPEAQENLKTGFSTYGFSGRDFYLLLANGHETYLEGDELLQVLRWGLLPADLREVKVWQDGEQRLVWQNPDVTAGWRVVYDYGDDEDTAKFVFDGIAKPFDRADTLKLVSPDGETLNVFDVLKDSHYGSSEETEAWDGAARAAETSEKEA